MRTFLTAAVLTLAGCQSESAQQPVGQNAAALVAEQKPTFDRFSDDRSHISFEMLPGVATKIEHFDPTLPAYKFRHLIELQIREGNAVVIEIWDNPTGQFIRPWFEENLKGMVDDHTRISMREAGAEKMETLLLEQPQSPMAPSLAVAYFATQSHIAAVTCIDADGIGSAFPRAVFEKILETVELGVTP